jgi:hypothetical protein
VPDVPVASKEELASHILKKNTGHIVPLYNSWREECYVTGRENDYRRAGQEDWCLHTNDTLLFKGKAFAHAR